MRGLAYLDAAAVDAESHHPDPDARAAAAERSAILTPITKAWCTDLGVELTSLAVQVHGGMGFIEETGVAQHMRDARINPIYEGTNGIQALDLVARKLPMRAGGAITDLLDEVAATAEAAKATDGPLSSMGLGLAAAETSVRETTSTVLEYMSDAPVEAFAGATPYLKMLGQLLGAWTLVAQAQAAQGRLDDGEVDARLDAKLVTAAFYCNQLLPLGLAQEQAAIAGAESLMALTPEQFGG
jgi:hypothetical protein